MAFARYAATVKNLRGVALFDLGEEGVEKSIKWLASRFRYRDIGVGPSIATRFRAALSRYLGGKPFKEIVLPIPSLGKLVDLLRELHNLPHEVSEALVLSSVYISPLLIVGNRYLEHVAKLSTRVVYVDDPKKMDTNSWKLHLRIADYTILDFYEGCVEEALRVLRGEASVDEVVEDRRRRIEKDVRRYWRIAKESGTPFLLYIDMLSLLRGSINELEEDHAAGLAIVSAVFIPPDMG